MKSDAYWQIRADFAGLNTKQEHYKQTILNHPYCDGIDDCIRQLKSFYDNNPKPGGSRSFENDQEKLVLEYESFRQNKQNQQNLIREYFKRTYSYFLEIVSDFRKGILSKETFCSYLEQYRDAIQQNQNIHLNFWDADPIDKIQSNISDHVQ